MTRRSRGATIRRMDADVVVVGAGARGPRLRGRAGPRGARGRRRGAALARPARRRARATARSSTRGSTTRRDRSRPGSASAATGASRSSARRTASRSGGSGSGSSRWSRTRRPASPRSSREDARTAWPSRRSPLSRFRAEEPHVRAAAAVLSPSTGILDVHGLFRALRVIAEENGASFAFRHALKAAARVPGGYDLVFDDPVGRGGPTVGLPRRERRRARRRPRRGDAGPRRRRGGLPPLVDEGKLLPDSPRPAATSRSDSSTRYIPAGLREPPRHSPDGRPRRRAEARSRRRGPRGASGRTTRSPRSSASRSSRPRGPLPPRARAGRPLAGPVGNPGAPPGARRSLPGLRHLRGVGARAPRLGEPRRDRVAGPDELPRDRARGEGSSSGAERSGGPRRLVIGRPRPARRFGAR